MSGLGPLVLWYYYVVVVFRNEETEIEIDPENIPLELSNHDALSLHSKHSLFGSRSDLSGGARGAISMEDLHCESDGAMYLAKTGKQIHLTRHGIEFTDVKERENKSARLTDKHEHKESQKEQDQNGGTFFLPMETSPTKNSTFQNNFISNSMETEKNHKDFKNVNDAVIAGKTEEVGESDKLLKVDSLNHLTADDKLVGNGGSVVVERSVEARETESRCGHICHVIRNLSAVKLLR